MSPTYTRPSGPTDTASMSRACPTPDRVTVATVRPVRPSTANTREPSSLSLCVQ